MNDVRIQVRLERLEVGPSPASEELVLQMPEDLRGRAVVDAVALPRHALHHAGPLEPPRPRRVPALLFVFNKKLMIGAGDIFLDSSLIPSPPIMPQDRARVDDP